MDYLLIILFIISIFYDLITIIYDLVFILDNLYFILLNMLITHQLTLILKLVLFLIYYIRYNYFIHSFYNLNNKSQIILIYLIIIIKSKEFTFWD